MNKEKVLKMIDEISKYLWEIDTHATYHVSLSQIRKRIEELPEPKFT